MDFDFGHWAFKNSKLVTFLIAMLVMGGVFAYYDMSKLEDPEIKVRQALVVGIYPGASAHQVELELVDPLEKSIRQMSSIYTVQSNCYADMCIITVELQSTVPENELEQQWDILRRKVQATALPSGVRSVSVRDDFGDVFGMFYAVTGDGLTDRQLSDYAEFIKRELGAVDGVGRIEIYGKRTECINVSMHQDKMANLGIAPIEVIQTLNGQNESVYSGYYHAGDHRLRVAVNDKYRSVDDIAGLIIQGHEQDQVRLGDLADVEMEYDEPVRASMQYDGQHALGVCIAARAGTDITKVGAAVDRRMEELCAQRLPAGVEFHKVFFQPERVNDSLSTFLVNLIESVLLVVFVLIFTMGLRSGLIIGAELVVIVLGSILVLYTQDGTLQRVSLGAFILAMGMLVDNAIVIVDGILVDQSAGKPRMEALTDIGRKTAMPLLGATLIAILAFLPIFLSPDTTGIYVRDLFIVIAVSLLLSWILALVHIPLMAARFLGTPSTLPAKEGKESIFYRLLRSVIEFSLGHRWNVLFVLVALFIGSLVCYQFLPQGFFPDMAYNQLYMEYKLPEGVESTRVQRDLDSIQALLRRNPDVTHITVSTGGTPARYNLVRSIATPSLSYGELIIDFKDPDALVEHMENLQVAISERFPDAYVKLKRYNLMYKKYPIEAQFSGPDPAVLHQLADSCRAAMLRTGAVRLITTDWDPQVPMLMVDYSQQNARRQGLSRKEVGTSLLAATDGIPVGSFYDGIHNQPIYVNTLDADGNPVDNLGEATVFNMLPRVADVISRQNLEGLMTGSIQKSDLLEQAFNSTPLRQVGNGVSVEWEDPLVIRFNGQRAQRVQCSPVPGLGTEEARQRVEAELLKMSLPEGYALSWAGEKEASDQSMKYLFKNFPLAIILMIAILIMLFMDYKTPVILFSCIPMILIGVIPAVLISGKTFGFVAIVGLLGLIGMMLKNGIVLMDEIRLEISEGKAPRQALIDSSLSRLRPVLMAAATTILGMVPLLPDPMFGGMAATIMGGLFMGTIITLLIIPVLYAIFFNIKD